MGSAATDPATICDMICVAASDTINAVSVLDLNDADKIDIGNYEHVMVIVDCGGATASVTCDVTLREGATRSGPETEFHAFTQIVQANAVGCQQHIFSTRGRQRYLQVRVSTGVTGNVRLGVLVLGFGTRVTENTDLTSPKVELGIS